MTNERELRDISAARHAWEEGPYSAFRGRVPEYKERFTTLSGLPVAPLYTPADVAHQDYLRDVGFPGEYPYTRGRTRHPTRDRRRRLPLPAPEGGQRAGGGGCQSLPRPAVDDAGDPVELHAVNPRTEALQIERVRHVRAHRDDAGVEAALRALRDAGMEVIYTGLHRTPEEVVNAVVQEDAEFLGMSMLSGAHMTIFPRILELLRAEDAEDIVLFGGGVIPAADLKVLTELGVAEVVVQDTPTDETVAWIRQTAERQRIAVV